jgi:hypothetical protein
MEDWRVVNMSVSTTAKSMSNLEEIMLGGARQSILLQSENIDNPILLCLHGGPGMPFPGVSCRGVDYVVNLTTNYSSLLGPTRDREISEGHSC